MSREIRFDISSPTAVNFRGASYTIYYNPLLYLKLSLKQMGSTIKHEILHILSLHLIRAKELRSSYSNLAVNMAMDIVVNKYLDYLPPYATTLEWVNHHYALSLEPYQPFEYYVEKLQIALDLLEEEADELEDDSNPDETMEPEYSADKTHDLWEASEEIDEKTMQEFTDKVTQLSEKGEIPTYLKGMIASLRNSKGELPWNLYLNRLMGTIESNKKKIITRRSRRQPDRLDLKGELRSHKAKIAIAIDISGSISDEEFKQAMKEVLSIVKNYKHEITMIECDDEIKRVYKVKSIKDIRERLSTRGGTRFNPVFEYANHNKINLLVYFTDGEGEARLQTTPRGYKILWVISGNGDKLSLKESYGAVKKLSRIEVKDNILDSSDVSSGGYSMNNQEKI
jgi:predicted metal-dependent peptidase